MAKPNNKYWVILTASKDNPKFELAGPVASWVWICANCVAREKLTDGFIASGSLQVRGLTQKQVQKATDALVAAKLFKVVDGGYTINDFLKHHPSREMVTSGRQSDADRKRELRSSSERTRSTDVSADKTRTDRGQSADTSRTDRGQDADATSTSLSTSVLVLEVQDSKEQEQKKEHPVREVLTYHEELFREFNSGAAPAKYTAADAKHAKDLIAQHGKDFTKKIIRQAFVTHDDFVRRTGRSMGVIASSAVQNKLIAELAGSTAKGDGFDGLRDFVKHG